MTDTDDDTEFVYAPVPPEAAEYLADHADEWEAARRAAVERLVGR